MKFLLKIYEWLQKNLKPPSAFSWQTLIMLSIFSYYMEWLAINGILKILLYNLGWIFLIFGVYWATTSTRFLRYGYKQKPFTPGFPFSPWITGALISFYLFGSRTGEIRPEAIVYWPIISAVIYAIPDFLGNQLNLKNPPSDRRQYLVVVLSIQLLLSCWFQFYFVIQNWIAQYPSLLADDFRKSAFVVKWEAPLATPRGADILELMEPRLRDKLNSRSWPEVERSLLQGNARDQWINSMAQQTKKQLTPAQEDDLWQVKYDVKKSKDSGYNLALQALWLGPRSKPQQKYSLVKYCKITPVALNASPETKPLNTSQTSPTAVSHFECNPVKGWGVDKPKIPNDSFIKL